MFGRCCSRLFVISLLVLAPLTLSAQSDSPTFDLALPPRVVAPPGPEPAPPRLPGRLPLPPVTVGLPRLARAAGIIFAGTVTGIASQPAKAGQPVATVAITFHIDNAIRGVTVGESLTVSQWMALWSSGQRYRLGEHVLLFLFPPSKLGLTSCVGGAMGRFTVDPIGRVLLTAQHLSAFRQDAVLGGKSRVSISDFARAVEHASQEEESP